MPKMKPTEKTKKNSSKVSSRLSLGERVPKLRFPGFEGEWEEKRIGDLLTIYHGRDYKHLNPGKIPVLGTGGIITHVDTALCDWSCTLIGRKGTIDKPQYMNQPFWSVDTLFYTKSKSGHNPLWQYYLFHTIPWKRYDDSTGVPSLSASTISSIVVHIPKFAEQKTQANFLSLLDSRIAAQRKLVELLKKHKRGLLREVFEENNEGDYRPFSEIAKRRNDKIAPMPDSTLKCIELEHIEPETGRIIGSVPLNGQTSLKNFCRPDDIIFGKLRPYLRKFAFAEDDSAASSETWVLVAVKDILPRFLFYLIQSEPFMRAASVSSGTKMPRSEWSNVASARFRIPDERRQCIIAESFSLFDKRIQESQLIAEAMESVKRGLLQALFV